MRKSSSVQAMPLDFNPDQFRVGHSKVDNLPIRRHSASHLQTLPPALTQLQLLRAQNALLAKENSQLSKQNGQLKRQLQEYQVGSSNKNKGTGQKMPQYRDIIHTKMTKVKQSRQTECETGLLSSKEVSLDPSNLSISDFYDQYRMNRKLPGLQDLTDMADRFFNDYKHNYAKLKALFDLLQCPFNTQPQQYTQLQQLLELYRLPLLYQKSPQALLRDISRQHTSKDSKNKKDKKEDSKGKKEEGKAKKEEICWEQLSPLETAGRIQRLLGKVCRSGQVMDYLKDNDNVRAFFRRLQERP